jgi:hypothetical protein
MPTSFIPPRGAKARCCSSINFSWDGGQEQPQFREPRSGWHQRLHPGIQVLVFPSGTHAFPWVPPSEKYAQLSSMTAGLSTNPPPPYVSMCEG